MSFGDQSRKLSATTLLSKGLTPGKLRGLQRISNPDGTLTILALDQKGLANVWAPGNPVAANYFPQGSPYYDASLNYPAQDSAQAQQLFGRGETLDKIEVHITDPDQVNLVRTRIQEAAGSDVVAFGLFEDDRESKDTK